MVHANSMSYSPYGAYELKAAYQKNMLMGLLCVILIGILLGLTLWLLQTPMEIIPIQPQPPLDGGPVPTTPQPAFPTGPVEPSPPAPNAGGGIPVPVSDDALSDADTNVILSPREYDYGLVQDTTGNQGMYIDTNVTDILPSPDEFIPLEYLPELISRAPLSYPEMAKRAGMTGVVTVQVLLGKNGEPLKAIIGRTSGWKVLDDAALEAAFHNTYKPGIQNGTPVICWISYRVDFSLDR